MGAVAGNGDFILIAPRFRKVIEDGGNITIVELRNHAGPGEPRLFYILGQW